jgi:hypothetical protein
MYNQRPHWDPHNLLTRSNEDYLASPEEYHKAVEDCENILFQFINRQIYETTWVVQTEFLPLYQPVFNPYETAIDAVNESDIRYVFSPKFDPTHLGLLTPMRMTGLEYNKTMNVVDLQMLPGLPLRQILSFMATVICSQHISTQTTLKTLRMHLLFVCDVLDIHPLIHYMTYDDPEVMRAIVDHNRQYLVVWDDKAIQDYSISVFVKFQNKTHLYGYGPRDVSLRETLRNDSNRDIGKLRRVKKEVFDFYKARPLDMVTMYIVAVFYGIDPMQIEIVGYVAARITYLIHLKHLNKTHADTRLAALWNESTDPDPQEPGVIHPFSNPLLKTPVFSNNGCNTAANLKFTQVHSKKSEKVEV